MVLYSDSVPRLVYPTSKYCLAVISVHFLATLFVVSDEQQSHKIISDLTNQQLTFQTTVFENQQKSYKSRETIKTHIPSINYFF